MKLKIFIAAACLLFVQNSFCFSTEFTNNGDIQVWVKQEIKGEEDIRPKAGKRINPGETRSWTSEKQCQGIRVYSGRGYEDKHELDRYVFCNQRKATNPTGGTSTICELGSESGNMHWRLEGEKGKSRPIGNRDGCEGSSKCSKGGSTTYEIVLEKVD